MKEKIVAALKVKYPGMPAAMLGLYADKLLPKCTTEDQITGLIEGLENGEIKPSDYMQYAQTEGDRRATEAATTREAELKKKFNFTPIDASNPPQPPTPPNPPQPPAPVNPELESLKKRMEEIESGNVQKQLQEDFAKFLVDKKIPAFMGKGRTFTTKEELTAAMTEIENDWTSHQQETINKEAAANPVPLTSTDYKGVDADIEKWSKEQTPAAATAK